MQEVVWQEQNNIEIQLYNKVSVEDMKSAVHQLESLCAQHDRVNVLLDTGGMDDYDPEIVKEHAEFYRKYKGKLNRFAVVSENDFQRFLLETFDEVSDTEIRTFTNAETDEARQWIFPARLPG